MTVAEVLREAGYFTAMAGKWHLGQRNGSPPWQRGFDRVLNIRAGGIFFPNQNFQGGDELTERGQEPLYLDGNPVPRDSPLLRENWYTTFLWSEFGLKFVAEARAAKKPFFLYVAHNAPHFPLMAPAELIATYGGSYKVGWDRLREARYRRQIKMGLIDRRWPLSPREPVAGVGVAVRRSQGSVRSSDGRLRGDDRGHRHERRHVRARRQSRYSLGQVEAGVTVSGRWELYDMTADRVERSDLAAHHPALVDTLAAEWDTWAKRANVDPWTGPHRKNWGDEKAAAK